MSEEEDKTTVQTSMDVRRDLKTLAAVYDFTYDELLKNMIKTYKIAQTAKNRAELLSISLDEYVERVIKLDIEKSRQFMNSEDNKTIICPNPKCRAVLVVNRNDEVFDCPMCNGEILSSEMEEVKEGEN